MTNLWGRILPAKADNGYGGSSLTAASFALIAAVSAIRSCIHLLAPDGGAGSIAGMDLTVAGAEGIVFAFALWGSSQLVYAVIQLVVAFRYRSLIPLMYLLLIAEISLRILVGAIKPVPFANTPPGAVANWVLLPLAMVMFVVSVRPQREQKEA